MVSLETQQLIERAERLYAERYKTELEASHLHSFVAIEPESGEYFLGPTLSEAAAACRAVFPNRRAHIMRVGYPAAIHMGGML
jgi:hypothetical protein